MRPFALAVAIWTTLSEFLTEQFIGTRCILFVVLSLASAFILSGCAGLLIAAHYGPQPFINGLFQGRPDELEYCSKDQRANLLKFVRTGLPCLDQFNEKTAPAITNAIANGRVAEEIENLCLIEYAIQKGSPISLKVLLENGADPGKCPGSTNALFDQIFSRLRIEENRFDQPALKFATVLREANYLPTSAIKLLFDAAKQGSPSGVYLAHIILGVPSNVTDSNGLSPLHHAIFATPTQESWKTMIRLLEYGAELTFASPGNETPLQKGRRLYAGTEWEKMFEHWVHRYPAKKNAPELKMPTIAR